MKVELSPRWIVPASLLLAGLAAAIFVMTPASLDSLLGETGIVERGTALLYALAAAMAVVCAMRGRGFLRGFALFWLALSILSFGEETSWLQHEIGFSTPEFVRGRNVQGEFNIHNLQGIHGGKFFGQDASSPALGRLASAQNLFQLGFVLFFAALPVLVAFGPAALRALVQRLPLPFAGLQLALVIWVPILTVAALGVVTDGIVKDFAAEVREMLYAASFLLFLACLGYQLRAARDQCGLSQQGYS